MTENLNALQLVERVFDAEFRFMKAKTHEIGILASAFDTDVVVHEPEALPYRGTWRGIDRVAELITTMGNTWSDMKAENLEAAKNGDTVFMKCTLSLTSRATGRSLIQPFAETLRFRAGRLIEGTPFYFDTAAVLKLLANG